jgi:predicted DNA-binding transcriptional regulator YafY
LRKTVLTFREEKHTQLEQVHFAAGKNGVKDMGAKWDNDAGPNDKVLRIFALLLFTQKRYSLGDLADMLECSKQTVLRAIATLESVGWTKIVQEKEGRQSVYRMARPGRLPQVSLNPEGLETLILCSNFLKHLLPDSMRRHTEAAIHQSFAYMPEEDAALAAMASGISGGYVKGRINYSQSQAVLQTLLRAAKMQSVCDVSYRSATRAEPRAFSFAPMKLLSHHESLYIVGWEVSDKGRVTPVRKEPSPLLLQRFASAVPTRRVWKTLPAPDVSSAFGIIPGSPFRVSLRITAPETITYVTERIWSNDQEIIHADDGSATLRFTAQSPLEVLSWVLSLGSAAEVLSPDDLREKIRHEVAVLAKRYAHKK